MDYKKLIHRLIATERLEKNYNSDYSGIYSDAANAITDLLARAKAAEARAEKAEREKNEAVESICMRCSVLPCRKNECYWYRFKKEE